MLCNDRGLRSTINVLSNRVVQNDFGIYDEELVNALIPTSDGGYAVAGIASSPSLSAAANQPVSYFWLVKIDSSGNINGAIFILKQGNDAGAYSVVQTSDGGYALMGTSILSNGTDQEVWLLKTDSNGNLQWNKTVDTGYTYNFVISLLQTKGGDYVLAGSGSSGTTGNTGWLMETIPMATYCGNKLMKM